MKKKILSIALIVIFLIMGLLTSYASAEQIKSANLDEDTYMIGVRCWKNFFITDRSCPYYYPDEFETDLEITDLNTNEKIILTEEDMCPEDSDYDYQYYYVDLGKSHSYNIKCSIELPGNYVPTRDYLEENVYTLEYPDDFPLASFTFHSELNLKSHSVMSLFLNRFPLLQKLL